MIAGLLGAGLVIARCGRRDETPVPRAQPSASTSVTELEQTLDRLDTEAFFMPTLIASGHGTVRSVLLATAEARWLATHRADALAPMLRRLATPGSIQRAETRSAYFVLLEQAGDPVALAPILAWMDAVGDEEAVRIDSPWHPWRHALSAVRTLSRDPSIPTDARDAFRDRRALVARLTPTRAGN